MLGMAEGAPAGRAGVSQGPEWAKPVLSRHGTRSHAAREPQVERLSRASWGCCHLSLWAWGGVSSPADLSHLGARACDFPYSDLQKPHPVSDHLLGQAIRGDDKQTHRIHTNGNGDKKSH